MRRISFIVLPGFQVMSVGALSVFEFAHRSQFALPILDQSAACENHCGHWFHERAAPRGYTTPC
jgi:hypothetical protein